MPKGRKIDKEELKKRRVKGGALLDEGMSQAEVARRVGVSRESVRRWAAMSPTELNKVRTLGRPSRLKAAERERLREILLAGPKAAGFQTELWTVPRVRRTIAQRLGLKFSTVHVWRLLGQLGFSPQKAVSRARERDENKITQWKNQDWPRLKKKPGGKAAQSSSSMKAV